MKCVNPVRLATEALKRAFASCFESASANSRQQPSRITHLVSHWSGLAKLTAGIPGSIETNLSLSGKTVPDTRHELTLIIHNWKVVRDDWSRGNFSPLTPAGVLECTVGPLTARSARAPKVQPNTVTESNSIMFTFFLESKTDRFLNYIQNIFS